MARARGADSVVVGILEFAAQVSEPLNCLSFVSTAVQLAIRRDRQNAGKPDDLPDTKGAPARKPGLQESWTTWKRQRPKGDPMAHHRDLKYFRKAYGLRPSE
jgi:hypothetical protein